MLNPKEYIYIEVNSQSIITFWETTWSVSASGLSLGFGPSSDTRIYIRTIILKIINPKAYLLSKSLLLNINIEYKTDAANKNLNMPFAKIICGSKKRSAGVNATPIHDRPPKIPHRDAKKFNKLKSNTFLIEKKSIENVNPQIDKLKLNNINEIIFFSPE